MSLKDERNFKRITSRTVKDDNTKQQKPRFRGVSVFLVILAFSIIGALFGGLFAFIDSSSRLGPEDFEFKNLSTNFYDKDGIHTATIHGEENRTVVSLNNISKYVPEAFVSIEDERFYKHHGIDVKRTAGAVVNYITKMGHSYGGSTLTQQLIKNVTGDDQHTPARKVQEWIRALQVETWLSKDEIMELYLNTIYLGEGAYGIQAASNVYFSKDAKDLTLAESALIAGVTRYPGTYDPFKNEAESLKRQKTVLAKMKQLGSITEDEYNQAIAQKLDFKKGVIKKSNKNSYFVDAVIEDVVADLQKEKNISKQMALNMIYSNGFKVYTTMDKNVQEALDDAYITNKTLFGSFSGKTEGPQSSMLIMDYTNGHVVGLIGGRGEKSMNLSLNRATQTVRQPGSSIKPIAVYGPALNDGVITPATVVDDVPTSVSLGGGRYWSPKNWYKDGFWGLSTVRKAIEQSMNVVAVKVLLAEGLDNSYDYLKKFGITSLTNADKAPAALGLGGLTEGVSVEQMTGAYGAIANGGIYVKPITYTKVVDNKGNIILENEVQTKRVLDSGAAYLLTDMMKGVVNSGTGGAARISNMPVAGKTGTTTSNKDKWFVGFTPYYVAATWFGYDEPKAISTSTNYSAKVWQYVMAKVHKNLKTKNFDMPNNIVQEQICIDSGDVPGAYCSQDPRGSRVRTEYFIKGTEPTNVCSVHVKVNICIESKLLANPRCPITKEKVMIVRPQPYVPEAGAPKPKDSIYEAPMGEYCNIH